MKFSLIDNIRGKQGKEKKQEKEKKLKSAFFRKHRTNTMGKLPEKPSLRAKISKDVPKLFSLAR